LDGALDYEKVKGVWMGSKIEGNVVIIWVKVFMKGSNYFLRIERKRDGKSSF